MRKLFLIGLLGHIVLADYPYLDKPYPTNPKIKVFTDAMFTDTKDHVGENFKFQSPVKSQGARGTCSIFSSTALAEAMVIKTFAQSNALDLSEEWLEYLVTRNKSSDGSYSYINLDTILSNGLALESKLPYVGSTWEKLDDDDLAKTRCQKVPSYLQKSCLIGHRDPRLWNASEKELTDPKGDLYDPEFLEARKNASENRNKYFYNHFSYESLNSSTEIKRSLQDGVPVLVDLDFYYGTWNHRAGSVLGINIDLANWAKGIVGYPEPGSMDLAHSHDDPAGHSVLIIGFDDNYSVTTKSKMEDGTTKTFTYTGVFIFKNSWGTGSFGRDFTWNGTQHQGYGVMTQKYAYEYGSFYRMVP